MRRKPYPFVHSIVDRYGRTHHYLRRRGFPSVTLPGPIGSRQFLEAYQAALAEASSTVGRAASGTVAALVKLYYASPEWLTLALQSQRTYRNILESFVAEHGDKSVRALEREHVKAMVNAKAATPAAANKFRKLLSVLMRVAIDTGWRDDNPVTTVKGIRTKSDGFRTWTDEEIAAFRARHQVGTKPRLALELLLCTGQRRGDAVLMGYQHLKNGVLTIRQQKTRIEELQACLNAAPRDHLTF
jgi:integrase